MKFRDLLLLSTREFSSRPMRTALTILGVSVGIGAVLFLVSLGYGLQNAVLNRITTTDSLLTLDVGPGPSNIVVLDRAKLDEIAAIPEVSEISPVFNLSGQISYGDLTGDSLIYGVDSAFFRLSGTVPKYGEVFGPEDSYGAVVSSAAAKLFNLTPEEVIGKKVSLSFLVTKEDTGELFNEIYLIKKEESYEIKGVVEDENSSFMFISSATLTDLDSGKYAQAKVKVSKDVYMEEVKAKIMETGLIVSSLSETIDQAKKIFRIVQIVLALFGLVALVVSAIGMFNTMTVTLLERINDIGIMRAIGASAGDIRILFLIESVIMGFLGGMGGIVIGYTGGEIANFAVNVLAKSFGGQALNLFYRPLWFLGFIIVFSTLIGFFTGLYPARKASRLNPLDALRYK